MRILIDGYNLLFAEGSVPKKPKGLEKARERLILQLIHYNRRRKYQINVVFDGEGSAPVTGAGLHKRGINMPQVSRPSAQAGIKTIFTQRDKDADTFIIESVLNDPQQADILVVSSDRAIRNALRQTKAKLVKADEFLNELEEQEITMTKKDKDLFEPPEKTFGIPKSEVAGWLEVFGFEEEKEE